jgi:hypothetical protein
MTPGPGPAGRVCTAYFVTYPRSPYLMCNGLQVKHSSAVLHALTVALGCPGLQKTTVQGKHVASLLSLLLQRDMFAPSPSKLSPPKPFPLSYSDLKGSTPACCLPNVARIPPSCRMLLTSPPSKEPGREVRMTRCSRRLRCSCSRGVTCDIRDAQSLMLMKMQGQQSVCEC